MVFSAISLRQIATGCNLVICLLKKKTMLLGAYVVLQFRQQLRQYLWKMSEFVSDL